MSALADALGTAAALLTVVFAWPQAIRALRAASTEGLSLASTALMLQSGLLWSVYGARAPSLYILVANVSVAAAALVTGWACRARLGPRRGPALLAGAGLVTLGAGLAGQVATGLAGDVVAALIAVPQAVRALRPGVQLEAVSPLTYLLLAVNAACWIGYGAAIGDPLVIAPNCVTLPASCVVLWRTRRRPAGA